VRSLTTKRYSQALPYLSEEAGARLDAEALRAGTEHLLNRTGLADDVEGESSTMHGEHASADVLLQTRRAGEQRLTFGLVREQGLWAIETLPKELSSWEK